jgi:predicted nucleotidyltransferase
MSENDQNLQEILRLCHEHQSVLRAVYLTGSRAFGTASDQSDYDLLFVFKTGIPFGEIKLLAMRLSLLKAKTEPFFISSEEINKTLHFSHPLFIPMMTAADHGKLIWGETLKLSWKPDRVSINACRVWGIYLILKIIDQKLWPEDLLRKKYFSFLMWSTLSLDPAIPEEDLASGQKVSNYFKSLWPQGERMLPDDFEVAVSEIKKAIAPRIESYLNLNKVEPVLFKSWLPTLATLVGEEGEGQLVDFRQKFLYLLDGHWEIPGPVL